MVDGVLEQQQTIDLLQQLLDLELKREEEKLLQQELDAESEQTLLLEQEDAQQLQQQELEFRDSLINAVESQSLEYEHYFLQLLELQQSQIVLEEQQLERLQATSHYTQYTSQILVVLVVLIVANWMASKVASLFDGLFR